MADVVISNLPRLGHVGRADGIVDFTGHVTIQDQDDVVEAIIIMRKGENPTQVVQSVKKKIDKLNDLVVPKDTKIVPYYHHKNLIHYASHTAWSGLTRWPRWG